MMTPILVDDCQNVNDFGQPSKYSFGMTIGHRIIGARLAAGFKNASDFARVAGVSRQYLNNLERDKVSKPDPAMLAKIADAANVDDHWLITGDGLPERTLRLSPEEQDLIAAYKKLSPEKQVALIAFLNAL